MSENAVARYEILVLTVPEITADETSMLESQLHSAISQLKGEVLSFERWGKYKLAYQVRKNDYGVYFLSRFDLPKNEQLGVAMEEIRRLLAVKYHDIVMRFVFGALDPKASLEYKRPESLEEMPRREGEGSRYGSDSSMEFGRGHGEFRGDSRGDGESHMHSESREESDQELKDEE
jgi:ribosomal protein S6